MREHLGAIDTDVQGSNVIPCHAHGRHLAGGRAGGEIDVSSIETPPSHPSGAWPGARVGTYVPMELAGGGNEATRDWVVGVLSD